LVQRDPGAANDTFANDAAFWGTMQKWRIMNTTNGIIELRDGANQPLPNVGVAAAVQLYAIDDPTQQSPINLLATYPNASFTYELLGSGSTREMNLVWNPVPEPTSLLALAVGGIGLLYAASPKRSRRGW
jgi:hypothetical protein